MISLAKHRIRPIRPAIEIGLVVANLYYQKWPDFIFFKTVLFRVAVRSHAFSPNVETIQAPGPNSGILRLPVE
jgi:hypothetical protein